MKKLLFASALLLSPLAAQAEGTETLTGRVSVEPVMCVRAPCPPIVKITDDAGKSTLIFGLFATDVASMAGLGDVTVTGKVRDGSMEVTAVAPGRSHDFVTGIVEDVSECTNSEDPSTCSYEVKIHTAGGGSVSVTDEEWARGLAGMDGAMVTVKGQITNTPCPPGMMCIQLYKPTLWPHGQAHVWVRGQLGDATLAATWEAGTEVPPYFLRFSTSSEAYVYTKKNWDSRLGAYAWVSGRFDGDKFRATRASRVIAPADTYYLPDVTFGGDGGETGSNVTRAEVTVPVDLYPGDEPGRIVVGGAAGAGYAR